MKTNILIVPKRACKKCGIPKQLDQFSRDNRKKPTYECKLCCLARQARWLREKRRKLPTLKSMLPPNATALLKFQITSLQRRIKANAERDAQTGCLESISAKAKFIAGKVRHGAGYPMMDVKLGDRWFQFPVCRVVAALYHRLDLNNPKEFACHIVSCNNPACVEQTHIYRGTNRTNQLDVALSKKATS